MQVASTKKAQGTFVKQEQVTFTKKEPPRWLLDMWKEIDDKTFGKGFDCFTEDAVCNLGVADWKGREAIRNNLRAFIGSGSPRSITSPNIGMPAS